MRGWLEQVRKEALIEILLPSKQLVKDGHFIWAQCGLCRKESDLSLLEEALHGMCFLPGDTT